MIRSCFVFMLFISIPFEIFSQNIECHIKGDVIATNSKVLFLYKSTENIKTEHVKIPIIDGHFEYVLNVDYSESYGLVFEDEFKKGRWRPVVFFSTQGEVKFKLYPDNRFNENIIDGGKVNKELQKYNFDFNLKFDALTNPIYDRLNLTDVSEDEIDELYNRLREIETEKLVWRNKYIGNRITLVSYYLMIKDLIWLKKSNLVIENAKNMELKYSDKYPKHPYTELIKGIFNSIEYLKIGGSFIDVSAPDLNGIVYNLSTIKKNDILLLDLWASWCKPCIEKSRKMKPVYDEFSDRGFSIIGISRESNNTSNLEKRLEIEQYPWLNLVELNDENKIWFKYRISNSAGAMYLIDKKGKILAINPTPKEVREVLLQLL